MCISYFSNLSFSWCSFKYNFVHQPFEFFGDNWFFIHMKMHRENCPPPPKMIYPGTNSIYVPDICLLFMNFIMNFVQSNLSLGYFYALIVNIFGVFVFPVSVFFFQLWRKPSMPTSITSRFVSLHLHIYTSTLYSIPSILMTMLALRKRTIKDYKEKIYIPVHSRMRKKKVIEY